MWGALSAMAAYDDATNELASRRNRATSCDLESTCHAIMSYFARK